MLEMHLTCPNCKKTFVVYDWQLWRDSEENESFQCPCCHTAPDEEACYRMNAGFLELCDVDRHWNHDKESAPLPPEKQSWHIEVKPG